MKSLIVAAIIVLSVGIAAYAQDDAANTAVPAAPAIEAAAPQAEPAAIPMDDAEGTEYGYGTVVSVNDAGKELVISEYNWETDSEGNVTYTVASDVVFENVASLAEIKQGSYVDVEYIAEKDGKRIAKLISVYEPEEEELAPVAEEAPAQAPAVPAANQ